MKEDNSVKVLFDMRDGIPKIAAVHMKLIHDTYTQLTAMGKKPVFVAVFIASAVKLISVFGRIDSFSCGRGQNNTGLPVDA